MREDATVVTVRISDVCPAPEAIDGCRALSEIHVFKR
jgi:hypothetical protein